MTEYPEGAVSVVKPQGTEETGNDRPAAPILSGDAMSNYCEKHACSKNDFNDCEKCDAEIILEDELQALQSENAALRKHRDGLSRDLIEAIEENKANASRLAEANAERLWAENSLASTARLVTQQTKERHELESKLDEMRSALRSIYSLADGISDDMTLPEIGTIALGALQEPPK